MDSAVIADDEFLARYVFSQSHVRADNTLRPDAFMPSPHVELSVNRHAGCSDEQIWDFGKDIGVQRNKQLVCRGDIQTGYCRALNLEVCHAPVPGNPFHANITCWPVEKHAQKIIAVQIAANAVVQYPENSV